MSSSTKKYVLDSPIIFERKTGKNRSKTLRDSREIERHLSRAAHRTVRAADKGLATYRKSQKKSAVKAPDEPLVDIVPNMLKGSAVMMRELSVVPLDLLRAAYTPRGRKLTRRTIRSMSRLADDLLDG